MARGTQTLQSGLNSVSGRSTNTKAFASKSTQCLILFDDSILSSGWPGGDSLSSRAGQIGRSVATAAMFLRSCVVQTLSRGDGSRHSLLASA